MSALMSDRYIILVLGDIVLGEVHAEISESMDNLCIRSLEACGVNDRRMGITKKNGAVLGAFGFLEGNLIARCIVPPEGFRPLGAAMTHNASHATAEAIARGIHISKYGNGPYP